MPRRTALIVVVPEAEPAVAELRLAHDRSAALGAPAHITILFPFATADDVDEHALGELFSRFRAFDFVLDRVERFEEGPVWLRPDPSAPFADLTAAVAQRFPDYPPYEGAFDEPDPAPHDQRDADRRAGAAADRVPRARGDVARGVESDGRWSARRVVPR